ncbi:RING-H2 finger protein ATL70-like [Trifolium pratense]|uniref:RING-H2 finger protein ATL70-like n=1 Tax=Trifolium pratense TaxID=57577 RepID=UPI001E69381E|nr:RING-H2 finger protein ATL70-like [Trifolium pratense]
MNNTSNSDNPLENLNILTYYYIGLSFALIFLMVFIALFSCYCNNRNRQNRLQFRGRNSNRPMVITETDNEVNMDVCEEEQDSILNSYPVLLFSQVKLHHKDDSTSLICSICLADYKDSELLRLLSDCGHFFHKECVATWFRLNMSCPMCRNSPLPTPIAQVTPLANQTTHD